MGTQIINNTEKETVITYLLKHSAAVHIDNSMSLLERKLFNILLKNAFNNLLKKSEHQIRISDLSYQIGWKTTSKQNAELKSALTSIASSPVTWNMLNKDKKNTWGVSSLISGAEITNGIITYRFDEKLRTLLGSPSLYARLNLDVHQKFKSKYAYILWEFFVEILGSHNTSVAKYEMLLTDLRKYLVVTDKYSEFKDLNRAILAPAIKEINKVSDIEISFDVKRHARKISHLIFSINKKKEFQPEFDSFGMERRILINSVKMEELGISLEDQKILTNKYDVNKIEKALLITRTDMLTKDIVNTAAYFKDALKGNWLIPTNSKNSNVLESSASVIPAPSANEHIALLQDKEWQSVLQKLLKQYGDSVFNNWIKHLEFEEKSKVEVKLSAPTKFIKEWCLKHYLSDLEKFWFETDNTIKKVTITVAKKNK